MGKGVPLSCPLGLDQLRPLMASSSPSIPRPPGPRATLQTIQVQLPLKAQQQAYREVSGGVVASGGGWARRRPPASLFSTDWIKIPCPEA